MSSRILVINPNSLTEVTAGIDQAVEPLRMAGGPLIECVTLAEGPPGVQSQIDADGTIQPMCRLIQARDNDCAAFIIACYSDPGLHAARETTRHPVLGIAQCGTLAALTMGERFGVISILPTSMKRQLRYVRGMGLAERYAGNGRPAGRGA
jgi:allantoin racemase